MARKEIRDESNARDDAALPKRTVRRDIAAERRAEDTPVGWSVGGEGRPSHPDGWQTGGR
jgi:hypothetical protein